MDSNKLNDITTSIQQKLGENAGLIADDIGLLITENNSVIESNTKMNNEISTLKNEKDNLLKVNANLLKQIPMGVEEKKENTESNTPKEFSFFDVFDEKGHFKRK